MTYQKTEKVKEFILSLEMKESQDIGRDDLIKYRQYFGSLSDEDRAKVIPSWVREKVGHAMTRELDKVYQLKLPVRTDNGWVEGKVAVEWPAGGITHTIGHDKTGHKVDVVKWGNVGWNPVNVRERLLQDKVDEILFNADGSMVL